MKKMLVVTLAAVALTMHMSRIPSYSVTIGAPRLQRVAEREVLTTLCGANALACTHISGLSFTGDCQSNASSTRARLEMSFVPYVYIGTRSPTWTLQHEFGHLDDLQQELERYARRIAATDFRTADECHATLVSEQQHFQATLRQFVAQSQEMRH